MNSLSQFLVESIMDEKGTIVSYGGGFKPPHKGHFNVIKRMIEKYPDAEVYNIFVGSKDRGGITQQDALDIWKIYKKYLSPKVSVRQSQIPISDVYSSAKENPDKNVIFAAGSRGEEDDKELLGRLTSYHKYDNLQLDVVRDQGGISATQLRNANPDELASFFPDELSDEDLEIVTNIALGVNEDTTRTTKKGAPGTFKAKITKAYGGPVTIEKAKKFKNRKGATAHDKSQANWFINMHSAKEGFDPKLGKDPYGISQYSREIMEAKKAADMDPLFIKDIEKNYGEVDLENDYFNDELTRYYKTTDINKETGGVTHDVINLPSFKDSFDKLKSAYLSFKQLQTAKQVSNDQKFPELVDKVKDAFNKYRTHLRTKYPSQYKTIKEEVDKMVNFLSEGVYDSITTKVSSDIFNAWKEFHDKYPDQEEFIYQNEYELQDKKGRDMDFELQAKIVFKETEEGIYSVDGGAEEGDEDIQGELTVIFQVDPRDLPNMWSTISMDLKDVVRHEIEHLSQRGYNVVYSKEMEDNRALRALIKAKLLPDKEYYKLEDEIPAMLQGMYFKAKKVKQPLKDVIKDYFDKVQLSKEDRKEIIALWKKYLPSLSLPPIQESKQISEDFPLSFDRVEYYKNHISNVIPPTVEVIREGDKLIVDGIYNSYPPNYMQNLTKEINDKMQAEEKISLKKSIDNNILDNFLDFCCKKLGISDNFFVSLHSNRDKLQTLAQYNLVDNSIDVYVKDRLMADILRSIAHELVHHQQLENGDIDLNNMPQDIGGPIEDEANAVAGQLVKEFGYDNPEIFENIDPKAQKKHQKNPTAVPFGSAYSPVKEDGKEVSDKNMDDYKKSNIKENKDKPKAIFMAGPAGSGKSYILNKLGIQGFTTINIDDEFEELLKKEIGKSRFSDMSPEELSQAAKLMGQARKTTSAKLDKARESLTNVIIDGTGAASNPILKKKKQFEDLGYETFMILIYVSPITSLMRNKGRDRSLPPSAILHTWKGVAQNMEIYKKEFGDNIVLINNDPEGADKTFDDPQEIMKQFPSPKGKPKTPEEIEKAREKKKKLNQEIQDLLKIEREFDNTKDAKLKVMNFTKGYIKEEKEGKFNIYLDMDGVVADFDQRFIDLSGMLPKEYEDKFGRKEFWDFIDEKNKLKFWVGIPEMSDAKQLVDYITPHGFQMLTAPSIKKQSYLGKMLWIKNHVGSLFSFKPYINFKKAKDKHNVKSNLTSNDILIDDREDTIARWNAAGGTGVHHTSASSTINKLKELGI